MRGRIIDKSWCEKNSKLLQATIKVKYEENNTITLQVKSQTSSPRGNHPHT